MPRPLPIDDVRAPLFTVGQVADMLGLHQSFLRRLDDQGVVSPARSEGRQRRYSRAEVEAIGHVVDLMGEGLTLNGVRRVMELQAEVTRLRGELAAAKARAGEPSVRAKPTVVAARR
jgi:excisionase family DNA binding protein